MEELLVTANKYNHVGVTGISTIDHRVRHKLKMSMEEYVIIDFIIQSKIEGIPVTAESVNKYIGLTIAEFNAAVIHLEKYGYLLSTITYEPSAIVLKAFDYDAAFEDLWKIMKTNAGNKKEGRKMWNRAVKYASINVLLKCAHNYAASKVGSDKKYWMHVSSFLNPEYAKWKDYMNKTDKGGESEKRTAEW